MTCNLRLDGGSRESSLPPCLCRALDQIIAAMMMWTGRVLKPNFAAALWTIGGGSRGVRVSRHVVVVRTADERQVRGKSSQGTASSFDFFSSPRIWFAFRAALVWCICVGLYFSSKSGADGGVYDPAEGRVVVSHV